MIEKIKGVDSNIDVQNNDALLNEIIGNRAYIIELNELLTKKETKMTKKKDLKPSSEIKIETITSDSYFKEISIEKMLEGAKKYLKKEKRSVIVGYDSNDELYVASNKPYIIDEIKLLSKAISFLIEDCMREKKINFKLKNQNINKLAEIKNDEPNTICVERDNMEKFLNELSIKGDDVDLSFKVVDKFEEHKDDEIINLEEENND